MIQLTYSIRRARRVRDEIKWIATGRVVRFCAIDRKAHHGYAAALGIDPAVEKVEIIVELTAICSNDLS
jgi:hypothetical protein